jgi:CDP-diglyceride synthetase
MIVEIHTRLGNTAFYYGVIMTLWTLWRIIRKQGVDSNYWGALVIAEVLVVLQGLLGVYLYFFGGVQLARNIHILYGILSVLVIPAAYAFTRGKRERRDMTIYAVSMLFMTLLVMRALQTSGPLFIFQ